MEDGIWRFCPFQSSTFSAVAHNARVNVSSWFNRKHIRRPFRVIVGGSSQLNVKWRLRQCDYPRGRRTRHPSSCSPDIYRRKKKTTNKIGSEVGQSHCVTSVGFSGTCIAITNYNHVNLRVTTDTRDVPVAVDEVGEEMTYGITGPTNANRLHHTGVTQLTHAEVTVKQLK